MWDAPLEAKVSHADLLAIFEPPPGAALPWVVERNRAVLVTAARRRAAQLELRPAKPILLSRSDFL